MCMLLEEYIYIYITTLFITVFDGHLGCDTIRSSALTNAFKSDINVKDKTLLILLNVI